MHDPKLGLSLLLYDMVGYPREVTSQWMLKNIHCSLFINMVGFT